MLEPIELQNLFFGTMSSAMIVLMGALYALFFALGRLHNSRALIAAAIGAFALLTAAVFVLIQSLQLSGFWIVVTSVMLIGYFLAPRAIWHLSVGTHKDEVADTQSRTAQ